MIGLVIIVILLILVVSAPRFILFMDARKEFKDRIKKSDNPLNYKIYIMKDDKVDETVDLIKKTMEENGDKHTFN